MKILKPVLIVLILCSIIIPSLSCAKNTATIPANQVVTVKRGNIEEDITASGNLAYSDYQDLAFQISGASTQQPLTVAEVDVQVGDSVEAGQVLVKADTVYLQQAITTATRAVKTSEIALEQATNNYRQITYPYTYKTWVLDIPEAIAYTSEIQRELKEAIAVMQELGLSREQYDWTQYWDVWHDLTDAQANLTQAREHLIKGSGPDVFASGIAPVSDYWTLRAAELSMETAQVSLDAANGNLSQAQDNIKNSVIVAPFAGFVTMVNVAGGAQVQRGVVAVRLVDPTKFEAELLVNEMDIVNLKLGGDATVQINAMPTLTIPAKVTFISPTATITSGVVNYEVKVELQTPQADQQGQGPAAPPANFQLRDGLAVTVSIILAQRTNVLLVPNAAITTQGGQSYVQVLTPSGTTEARAIKTGISNWQYTEVTEGLSEGDKVVVNQGTTTTPTSQQGGPQPIFFPR